MAIRRLTQIFVLAAVSVLHALVAFNNIIDYDSNFQFVAHEHTRVRRSPV